MSTRRCINTREHNECLKVKAGRRGARRHQHEQQQRLHLILLVQAEERVEELQLQEHRNSWKGHHCDGALEASPTAAPVANMRLGCLTHIYEAFL